MYDFGFSVSVRWKGTLVVRLGTSDMLKIEVSMAVSVFPFVLCLSTGRMRCGVGNFA